MHNITLNAITSYPSQALLAIQVIGAFVVSTKAYRKELFEFQYSGRNTQSPSNYGLKGGAMQREEIVTRLSKSFSIIPV
jgi:hypothetical protein